ncbi:MAG: homoserine kinase [Mycobacterium sp.]|nr:homoserine kinase [Mycobacterium sp.]
MTVRVPATSANLGPGFDALGLALDLADEVTVTVTADGLLLDVTGEGEATAGDGESHLVVRSLRAALDRLGVPQPTGLHLSCRNVIPHGRGLGSSSAAICAGVVGARLLAGLPADPAADLQLAAELEGHPDNVAPCLFGGATAAWTDRAGAHAARLVVDPALRPVALIPTGSSQATSAARAALPATVPHALAARTAGRAALLVAALAGQPELLLPATADELHQPFRVAAGSDGERLLAHLRNAGVAAVLSGSGPTVLALAVDEPGEALAAAAPAELRLDGWVVRPLAVDPAGARAG